MKPLVINIDSDGVVVDFTAGVTPFLEDAGYEVDTSEWNLGVPAEEFGRIFSKAIMSGVFISAPEIPGAVDAINALVADGHRVRIVTSKIMSNGKDTFYSELDTLGWYNTRGLSNLEFVFTGDKWGKTEYPADLVIDDHPRLEWAQHGRANLLFDQPWNRGVRYARPFGPTIQRLRGWADLPFYMDGTYLLEAV